MGVRTAPARGLRMRTGAGHGVWRRPAAVAQMSARAAEVERLSSGPRRLPRQQVVEIQRARILAAAVETIRQSSYGAMTVTALIQRARISRKTFYEIFPNRDECFAAVVEEIFARAYTVATAAYSAEDDWLAATRSALSSLLCLIDEEPRLARIWFVDATAGPQAVHRRTAEANAMLAAAVELGRAVTSERWQPPELAGEGIVGGISHIIHTRLARGAREPFAELLGPCMHLIVLPYLGVAQATAELRRGSSAQTPAPKAPDPRRHTGSLRNTRLRLTYRTVRALDVISAQPGVNNRTVAEESGIKDQGQVSKLLSRLERLALIENRGLGRDRGSSNAWHLTARGFDLLRAAGVHQPIRSRGASGT
jgi:AcrR family transcriptional regulator/DNA-binding MarR family transcriptional regulator